jgi:hypothetical protein
VFVGCDWAPMKIRTTAAAHAAPALVGAERALHQAIATATEAWPKGVEAAAELVAEFASVVPQTPPHARASLMAALARHTGLPAPLSLLLRLQLQNAEEYAADDGKDAGGWPLHVAATLAATTSAEVCLDAYVELCSPPAEAPSTPNRKQRREVEHGKAPRLEREGPAMRAAALALVATHLREPRWRHHPSAGYARLLAAVLGEVSARCEIPHP